MSYYGHDGGKYDDIHEKMAADNRYDKAVEQNELLKEQNELIRNQALLNAEIEKAKMNHEKEMKQLEVNKEKELLQMQIDHDKEMRILKMFDEAGLSKDSYDEFINMVFALSFDKVNMELDNICTEYKKRVKDFDLYFKDPKKNFNLVEDYVIEILNDKTALFEQINAFKSFLNDKHSVNIIDMRKYFKGNEEYKKSKLSKILASILIFIVSCLTGVALMSSDYGIMIYLLGSIAAVVVLVKGINTMPREMVEKEIKDLEDIANHMDQYDDYTNEIKNAYDNMKNAIKENDEYNKSYDKMLDSFKNVWDKFLDFRINHYNPNMEKILIETGVKDRIEGMNLKYTKVNNANKKGDGTIDEYEIFFDSATESVKENLRK